MYAAALSFFLKNWKVVGTVLAFLLVVGTGSIWVDRKLVESYEEGYNKAVLECNENALQASLDFANDKLEKLEELAEERQDIIDNKKVEYVDRVEYKDRVITKIEEVFVEGSCQEELGETSKTLLRSIQERQE